MVHPLNDVVVVIPGILGSTLHDKDGDEVWGLSGGSVSAALRTLGRSLKRLQLPEGVGDRHPGDGVTARALMPDLHLVPGIWTHNLGYDRILDWLRTTFHVVEPDDNDEVIPNLLTFPYDWRLSNRYNAKRLRTLVEPALEQWRAQGGDCAAAELVFVCHSMGGLVARWYLTKLGGLDYTRALVTFGTPYRGSIDSLDQLINGVTKGWGPFKVDLTDMARSCPSIHQLLPEFECLEHDGELRKTTETPLPDLSTVMVADAMDFHETMNNGPSLDHLMHPFVGYSQPTALTARLDGIRLVSIPTYRGEDSSGDGTVPRFSAAPKHLRLDHPSIRAVAEVHGTLQHNEKIFDQLEGILRAPRHEIPRGKDDPPPNPPVERPGIGVDHPSEVVQGETVVLKLTGTNERLTIHVGHESDTNLYDPIGVPRARRRGGRDIELPVLAPGAYTITVRSDEPQSTAPSAPRTALYVWPKELA